MNQPLECHNFTDANDNPAGGYVEATGIHISWQDGPLGRGGDRREPSGAFVEGVIAAALQRLQFYQQPAGIVGMFACRQNALAITKLEEALHWLQDRTAEREARGVEGTHEL